MTTAPCVRCGDFIAGEKLVVFGVALCRECLEHRHVDQGLVATVPPSPVRRRRLLVLGACMALGAALGLVLGALAPVSKDTDRVSNVLGYGLAGLVGGELGASVGLCSHLMHVRLPEWKAHLMKLVGLESVPPDRLAFGLLTHRGFVATYLYRQEIALLLEDEGGLALLGNRGTRAVIPVARIRSVAIARVPWFRLRAYARFELVDGAVVSFAIYEGPTYAAERRATAALVERVRARVEREAGAS